MPEENKDYTTGTPWLCSMIEGTVTADTPTAPKDDFYLYANKEYLVSGVIPPDQTEIGTVGYEMLKVSDDMQKMYDDVYPEPHDARLVYDFYHLAKDWESRDKLGITPPKEIADEIESMSSIEEMNAYFSGENNGMPKFCNSQLNSFHTLESNTSF